MTENQDISGSKTEPVLCSNCARVLVVDPSGSGDIKQPCPDCGSTERKLPFSKKRKVIVHDSAHFHEVSEVRAIYEAIDASPSLLMQTVVERGPKTDEGELIIAVTLPFYGILKLIEKDPNIAYQIKPRQWEEIVAGIYERARFDEVILTPYKADGGRDVIAIKKGIGTIRVIDQVKAYTPGNLVTHDHVRALMGVLDMDGASKGFLTTTSDFAPTLREDSLIKPHLGRRIELIDGSILRQRLLELLKKKDN